ncbi:HAD family hydrolase [Agaribacter flavus]|uniref:HAD family hydrolase n=1 Tax=Agaribacter flavus TaxID=1902781 RepID=A0ABV7FV29_9ALTE
MRKSIEMIFEFESVEGIIFDLDDTLISSNLTFSTIKQQLACPIDTDILSHIGQLSGAEKQRAEDIVLHYELADAYSAVWVSGARDFVTEAKSRDLPLAIVTRNSRKAAHIKLSNNAVPITQVITREDAPAKPDPSALLAVSEDWCIAPESIAYVGDYIYDVQAAHNANMQAWQYIASETSSTTFKNCLKFIPKNSK